jgi:hypothetical protein
MFSKRTANYFAQQAYWLASRYGKYDGTFMRGLCFWHVDYKNKVVDIMFSNEEMAYMFSLPIRKGWN